MWVLGTELRFFVLAKQTLLSLQIHIEVSRCFLLHVIGSIETCVTPAGFVNTDGESMENERVVFALLLTPTSTAATTRLASS